MVNSFSENISSLSFMLMHLHKEVTENKEMKLRDDESTGIELK